MAIDPTQFIFSDERKPRLARHITFWTVCVLFFTLVYGSKPIGSDTPNLYNMVTSYRLSFFEAIAYLPNHLFLSYMFMYVLIPRYLFTGKYISMLVGLGLCLLLVGVCSFFITQYIVVPFRNIISVGHPDSNFYFGLMAGVRGGLSIGGFAGAIKLGKHWYFKNQLNQQLESEKLKSELQLLKAQVHPHFLFNTLNNLYSLTLTQSEQAPEVVLKLAGLLRYMLYECNQPKVPLAKEINLISEYIELENLRYGHRLELSVNIHGDPDGLLIAPLLLLPFVENSFKHGASQYLDQAWVSLDLYVQENTLKFKLLNAFPETNSQPDLTSPNLSGGIGLQNVKKRLELIYPNTHELKIRQEADTFLVSLQLELERVPASLKSEFNLHRQPADLTQVEL